MRESKQQESPLFRLGGVYRQEDGDVVELAHGSESPIPRHESDIAWAKVPGGSCGYGFRSLITGEDVSVTALSEIRRLIPGELHKVDGKWIALRVDKPITMTPTLDKLEAEKQAEPAFLKDLRDLVAIQGSDGHWNHDDYMCGLYNGLELALATAEGREPQYRTLPAPVAAPISTAKPAISGLQRVYSSTHLLGSYR